MWSQNNFQRESEKLQVTKKSWCDKARHQTTQLELLPHRNPTPPWEEGILPQRLYAFQIQADWRALLQSSVAQTVAESCGVIMDQLQEGGMPAQTHVGINTADGCTHTRVCEYMCVCVFFTFLLSMLQPSVPKWNSPLQDLCQSHHIFLTCWGSGSDQRVVSPFLFFLPSHLSVPRFRSCNKQKGATHSIMITQMTLSDLH